MKIIAGVETVDHPSDAQLVAYARHYFKTEDLMLPQKGYARSLSIRFRFATSPAAATRSARAGSAAGHQHQGIEIALNRP